MGWFKKQPKRIKGGAELGHKPSASSHGDDFDYGPLYELARDYTQVARDYLLYKVVDEQRLPAPKSEIKAALKLLIDRHRGEDAEENFKHAYYWLSKFQPDTEEVEGTQRMCIDAWDKKIREEGDDITEDEYMAAVTELFDKFVPKGYLSLVKMEDVILKNELCEFDWLYEDMIKAEMS